MAWHLVGTNPLLNQFCNTVNWTPMNKLQWNLNRNSYIFIQENPFENVVWKMATILSWPQCVKNTGVYISIHMWSGLLLLGSSHMSLLIKIRYCAHRLCWRKYLVHKNASKSSRVACTMTCKIYPSGPESVQVYYWSSNQLYYLPFRLLYKEMARHIKSNLAYIGISFARKIIIIKTYYLLCGNECLL